MLIRSVWVVHYESNSTNGWTCLHCIVSVITSCSVLGARALQARPCADELPSPKQFPTIENFYGAAATSRAFQDQADSLALNQEDFGRLVCLPPLAATSPSRFD